MLGSGIIKINIGFSFIKLFQIIEILCKLLYLPVIYESTMRSFLVILNDMADPLGLPEDIFVKETFLESIKYFNRKISVYEERTIFLQSFPTTCMTIVLVLVALGMISLA